MATKAERFRAQQEHDAHGTRPKATPRPRRDTPVDTAQPGVSVTDRKAGGNSTASRNRSNRAGKKGGVMLEDSSSGKPSRKSTRRSTGRVKPASNLQRRTIRAVHSPEARATRQS
jgi:hypothetical protein